MQWTSAVVGVPRVPDVIQSSLHVLRLVGQYLQTRTGCVRRASITPIRVRSTIDVPARCAIRRSVPSVSASSFSQSHMYTV